MGREVNALICLKITHFEMRQFSFFGTNRYTLFIMGDYTRLEVWKLSKEFTVEVYKLTLNGKLARDYSLRDQIRRAAVSIPSNIAEGEESGFDKLGVRYFYNAKASLAELNTQLLICNEISYISQKEYLDLNEKIVTISKMLRKLIDYRIKYVKQNQK